MTKQADTSKIELAPGEYRAANGVIIGSGAELDIPRFGADETDLDDEAWRDIPGAMSPGFKPGE